MLQLRPLLQSLTLRDKDARLTNFDFTQKSEFAWAQGAFVDKVEEQYNAGKPVRIITLKARQVGISTVTEGVIFNWAWLHPGMSALIMAQESGTAQSILSKTKTFWETWPFRHDFSLKYNTKNDLLWRETGSNIKVATAKNVSGARGLTINALHATECAHYEDPVTLMGGLYQTIPNRHGSLIVLESTANGTGNWWHEQWEAAEEGDSDFAPLFFPWYHHREYVHDTTICTKLELDQYERWLIDLPGVTYRHIAWRRWAIKNLVNGDIQTFEQEYPAVPAEAFRSSGQPIFPHGKLTECYQAEMLIGGQVSTGARGLLISDPTNRKGVQWIEDPAGNLTIFKAPNPTDTRTDRYFIAGDPTMTVNGDYGCIQVLNRQTLEQVAVWHGRLDPIAFGEEMIKIGRFYNNAMLCPEIEGGGQATIATLLARNYPNIWQNQQADKAPGKVAMTYGMSMNFQRKSWVIGALKNLIVTNSITIHCRRTYNQLRDYIVRPNGQWGNSNEGKYDDAVMALAICVAASQREGPFVERNDLPSAMTDLFLQDYGNNDIYSQAGA